MNENELRELAKDYVMNFMANLPFKDQESRLLTATGIQREPSNWVDPENYYPTLMGILACNDLLKEDPVEEIEKSEYETVVDEVVDEIVAAAKDIENIVSEINAINYEIDNNSCVGHVTMSAYIEEEGEHAGQICVGLTGPVRWINSKAVADLMTTSPGWPEGLKWVDSDESSSLAWFKVY